MPADSASGFSHRLAREADIPAIRPLIAASIAVLLKPHLTAAQHEASSELMGLDTQLVEDGTYFLLYSEGRLAGCGGWSRRATHFGGDHTPGRDPRPLDPGTEPARVRAMYTHPDFARRGVGRRILALCEAGARDAGFSHVELAATMGGLPLYRACGYAEVQAFDEIAPCGTAVPLVRMRKAL